LLLPVQAVQWKYYLVKQNLQGVPIKTLAHIWFVNEKIMLNREQLRKIEIAHWLKN